MVRSPAKKKKTEYFYGNTYFDVITDRRSSRRRAGKISDSLKKKSVTLAVLKPASFEDNQRKRKI